MVVGRDATEKALRTHRLATRHGDLHVGVMKHRDQLGGAQPQQDIGRRTLKQLAQVVGRQAQRLLHPGAALLVEKSGEPALIQHRAAGVVAEVQSDRLHYTASA